MLRVVIPQDPEQLDPRFVADFNELFRYYRDAKLIQLRRTAGKLLAVVQTVVLHYVNVPQDIWLAIDGLLVTVIGTIALEDAAEKLRSIRVEGTFEETEAPPFSAPGDTLF